jgi:predicted DsbA family dithiol-disulfide isomerase
VKVEIWSDVVCPWCYIGKRRFETALGGFDGAADVEVVWRSFQLDPAHPKGVHESHAGSLAAKTGRTLGQVAELTANVTALAAAEGLDYHFEKYVVVNTFDAHRLTHLAKASGLGSELHERFLQAQLIEGEVLDDPETLVRLSAEVGVSADDARRVLESDAYASDVAADIDEARALGATGVPFFVIDRRFGVSGAQPSDLFLEVLERARDSAVGSAGPVRS